MKLYQVFFKWQQYYKIIKNNTYIYTREFVDLLELFISRIFIIGFVRFFFVFGNSVRKTKQKKLSNIIIINNDTQTEQFWIETNLVFNYSKKTTFSFNEQTNTTKKKHENKKQNPNEMKHYQ